MNVFAHSREDCVPTENSANPSLSPEIDRLFQEIRKVGFPLVSAVDFSLAKTDFKIHSDRYEEWIKNGYHGEMAYLERGLGRRRDPSLVFPEAKSIVVCAIPYRKNPTPRTLRYARYLEGPDYHSHLPALLESALLNSNITAKWKICVDTSAVLERTWAALAGLGWIGKNTLLIHPQLGSYLFIATILIDQETGLGPRQLTNYCGNCSACLTGCPTSAFTEPGFLDSKKCISYLTLEKRGEWSSLDEGEKKKIGTWIAGCDICQEVCPYNRKPLKTPETWPSDPRDQALIADWSILDHETQENYRARTVHTALSRVKFPDMVRNLKNAKKNQIERSSNSSP